MTGVRIRDLGPLEVERAGAAQAVGGARIEAALALLLIHAGQAVSTDALAEAMWGDQDRARSATTLDSHVWRPAQAARTGAGARVAADRPAA